MKATVRSVQAAYCNLFPDVFGCFELLEKKKKLIDFLNEK